MAAASLGGTIAGRAGPHKAPTGSVVVSCDHNGGTRRGRCWIEIYFRSRRVAGASAVGRSAATVSIRFASGTLRCRTEQIVQDVDNGRYITLRATELVLQCWVERAGKGPGVDTFTVMLHRFDNRPRAATAPARRRTRQGRWRRLGGRGRRRRGEGRRGRLAC